MYAVDSYAAVRRFVFVEGKSRREAARVFGLSRDTISKMCQFSAPPGYVRKKPPARPKLGPFVSIIDAILAADMTAPPKQRHTAKRIYDRLRAEHGFDGGYSAFLDGHVSAFAFFGGVPQSILYDNTKLAVARICGDGKRERTRAFSGLISHYLFRDRFGRPGKGNDKGKVEGLVKNGRRRFLTPVPAAASFEALNAKLEADCLSELDRGAGSHLETIGVRLQADLAAFRPLPSGVFEPCDRRTARVSSTALVRYRTSDYSVPTAYGYRDVTVKGFVDEVVIICAGEEIARHERSYKRGDFVCDPLHYLALIERKPGALDQARPLQDWALPEQFLQLRRLLEARMSDRGKREFIQVLRLMETFDQNLVADAVKDALKLGAPSFDAVKQLILCRIEKRPPRLDLAAYPYLPKAAVQSTRAADYTALLDQEAA